MEKNNVSKTHLIIWGILYTLLVIPYGAQLVPPLGGVDDFIFGRIAGSVSNIYYLIIILLSPLLLIISAISTSKNRLFGKWKKLFGIIFMINILICISNYVPFLSAVGNLGYAQLLIPDILLRAIALWYSYKLLTLWIVQKYPAEMHEEGRGIMKYFGNTQIIVFLIIEILSYFQFVLFVK